MNRIYSLSIEASLAKSSKDKEAAREQLRLKIYNCFLDKDEAPVIESINSAIKQGKNSALSILTKACEQVSNKHHFFTIDGTFLSQLFFLPVFINSDHPRARIPSISSIQEVINKTLLTAESRNNGEHIYLAPMILGERVANEITHYGIYQLHQAALDAKVSPATREMYTNTFSIQNTAGIPQLFFLVGIHISKRPDKNMEGRNTLSALLTPTILEKLNKQISAVFTPLETYPSIYSPGDPVEAILTAATAKQHLQLEQVIHQQLNENTDCLLGIPSPDGNIYLIVWEMASNIIKSYMFFKLPEEFKNNQQEFLLENYGYSTFNGSVYLGSSTISPKSTEEVLKMDIQTYLNTEGYINISEMARPSQN